MQKSAIPSKYWNATLIFEVAGDRLVADPVTGNLSPVSDCVETRAVIKEDTTLKKEHQQPGQGINEIPIRGYMAQPTKMPVQPPIEIDAIIDRKRGRLRILALVRSPFETEIQERYAGQKFEGYFKVQG